MNRKQAHVIVLGSIAIFVAAIGYYAYRTFYSSANGNPPTTVTNLANFTGCCDAKGANFAGTTNTVTTTLTLPPPSVADTQPPTTPTGLTATVGTQGTSNKVDLTWTASTDNVGVTGYKITRGGQALATSATTNYTDVGMVNGSYVYDVRAYDAAGNISGASNSASASFNSAPPPAPTIHVPWCRSA